MGFILRTYTYLFHLLLSLFLIGLAIVTLAGGKHNLQLGMLPWEGAALTYWILGLGLCGLACVAAAVMGRFRILLPVWALAALVLMLRGFFLSPYTFPDADQFHAALWLTGGALLAFLCSWSVLRRSASGH